MASKRCGCASDSCACIVTGGTGVVVSGTGTKTNPYVLDASLAVPSLTVQDENTTVRAGVTQIDFTGGGVQASMGDAGEVIVNVPAIGITQVSSATATAAVSMGVAPVDIPGCTLAITSSALTDKFLVHATVDITLQVATSSAATINLVVDTQLQNGQVIWVEPGSTAIGSRATVSQHWLITGVTPGTHSFKLQTGSVSPASAYGTSQTHTRLTVMRVA